MDNKSMLDYQEVVTSDLETKNLSVAEKEELSKISSSISFDDTAALSLYGTDIQKTLSSFSQNALSSVRSKDLGAVGDLMASLVSDLSDFDGRSQRILGIFKKPKAKITRLRAKYDTAENTVSKISKELELHRKTIVSDINTLDSMYELNLSYYKELSLYILAGKERLEKEKATTLISLKEKAKESGLLEDAEKVKSFEDKCERLEKRIYDLELTRTISLQTGPQIRLIQNSDVVLADKINSTILNTIPLWKSQMVIAIGSDNALKAAKAEKSVNDATNGLLNANAEMLKTASITAAKESERDLVDIDTLKHTNDALIKSFDEIKAIKQEGKEYRENAEKELINIEKQLKGKLLEVANA